MNPLVERTLQRARVEKAGKEATELSARLKKLTGTLGSIKDNHPAVISFRQALQHLEQAEKELDTALKDHSFFLKKG